MNMEEQDPIKPVESAEHADDEEPKWRGPFRLIIGLFLALIIIVWIVPHYAIKIDPAPDRIPEINEVISSDVELRERYNLSTRAALVEFVRAEDPVIKQAGTKIATLSCVKGQVCHAKAIYYFVRNNLEYVADPVDFDYVEEAREVLVTGGGDCESGTLLMASLMESVGIDSEIVMIPGHAFLRIYLKEANSKYKQKDGWIYLDWTCKSCDFGQVPTKNLENMQFIDV